MQEQPATIRGIRRNVLIGFGLALVAIVAAGLINFKSLNRLATSAEKLAQPNPRLFYIHQLLAGLSNEEDHVRAFSLTKDSTFIAKYHESADSVQASLGTLQLLSVGNEAQLQLIDSLQKLVDERDALLHAFLTQRLGSEKQYVVPPPKSIQVIQPAPAPSQTVIADTEVMEPVTDTIEKKGGFFNAIKNLFAGKKKKQEKNTEEKPVSPVPPDTLQAADEMQLLAEEQNRITASIIRQDSELKKQMRDWSLDEMVMLQNDKVMMDRIRSFTTRLEENENGVVATQARLADQHARNAQQAMLIVGLLAFISIIIFIYLILSDVARSNRLRAELVEQRQRAEDLAKVKEEFLASMSHEIRTPLNSIVGFSEQLGKLQGGEKLRTFTAAIQRASTHLLTLVNQILDYSKIESGKREHEEVPFNFYELVKEVYDTLRVRAAEKGISFAYRFDADVPEFLSGDALGVKQSLINLTGNAIKFTREGGVSITCCPVAEGKRSLTLKAEVADTGIGIPEEDQEKIFDAFAQQDVSTAKQFGGTGLGLAITKKIVTALGGNIEIRSMVGKGSVFSIIMPFRKAAGAGNEAEHGRPSESQVHFTNKTVLIADDEPLNIMLCETILKNWGMATDSAGNGQEALTKITNNDYDLILLDLQMPVMNGTETVHAIRSLADIKKKTVPVIALTANVYGKHDDARSGFSDVVIKPFTEATLYESFKKFLEPDVNHFDGLSRLQDGGERKESSLRTPSYSLNYLKRASGSNPEFIRNMVQTFITTHREHLKLLTAALENEDWTELHRLAHKMIPSFRYLEAATMENDLKMLEQQSEHRTDWNETKQLTQAIIGSVSHLLQALEEELNQSENQNTHADPPVTGYS